MKLIYVGNARIPSEKAHPFQMVQMCQAFQRQGMDVELVYPSRKHPIHVPDILAYYGVEDPFSLTRLFSIDWINTFPRKWQKMPFLFHGLTFSLRLFFYLLRSPARIIYTRDALSIYPLVKTLPEARLKAFFLEVHKLPEGRLGRKLALKVSKKVRGVITVTSHLKAEMVREGLGGEACLVAHDGVDLCRYTSLQEDKRALRRRLGLPVDTYLAGYVGRFKTLEMEKGLGDMIRALALIRKKTSDVEMCFVGGPLDQLEAYQALAASAGLDQKFLHFIDHVEPSRVPSFQKAFDLCMIPFPWTHHFAYNASPMKLFEYMASGNPIIATALPSTKEILKHEYNALLTEPGDPGALAAAVLRLKDNQALGQKLAAQAGRDVLNHTWEARAEQILKFIQIRTSTKH